ncbi:MAG: hypothetical protein J7599_02135 [Niabella sp.]|nr:hypothetical protein [Niabella sp.]
MIEDLRIKEPNTLVNRNIIICFAILAVLVYVMERKKWANFKEEGKLVTAKVVDYTLGKNNSLEVLFDYNKKVYKKYAWTSVEAYKWSRLVGHSFPALYTEDEDVIMLLVFPEDFKKYNIKPDSIPVWVRDNLMY